MEVALVNAGQIKELKKNAGWMALASTSKEVDYTKVYSHCVKAGHWTPTRQINFIYELKGLSRVCTHQLVRHSEGVHIVQESQRYVSMDSSNPPALPPTFKKAEAVFFPEYDMWLTPEEVIDISRYMYNALISEQGLSRENARYILTNAEPSNIRIALSPEALIHFAHLRLCVRAQEEIRKLAGAMVVLALEAAPELREYLVPKCEFTNCCDEVNSCGKYPSREEVNRLLRKDGRQY